MSVFSIGFAAKKKKPKEKDKIYDGLLGNIFISAENRSVNEAIFDFPEPFHMLLLHMHLLISGLRPSLNEKQLIFVAV